MSLIDFAQMQTAKDTARSAQDAHLAAVRAACGARIHGVCSAATQLNLAAAAAAGRLSKKDAGTHTALLDWVDAMRATATRLGAQPEVDVTEDANWPALPKGVAAMVARF